ncbi:LLM class flavin-dependent oxidoreductase [Streptomyces sp. NPDC020800]|uniref:LLM class flavin-dependent oxidoreductase n=1 Tax=Streptomyces sp. NPDC020800 TaxID=3365092 RepID=UPI0037AF2AEC
MAGEQEHSPYAWSVLGATAQVTSRIPLMTCVTCPTMRYHPAVVAQKAATIQLMSGGRFRLGMGSGRTSTSTSWAVVGPPPTSARRCSPAVALLAVAVAVAAVSRQPVVSRWDRAAAAVRADRGPD